MLTKGINVPRKENVERWLYELLRRQGANNQQIIYGIEAIGRGEQPDGSGNPLLPDLTNYFYLPGRTGGQIAHFDTRPSGTGVLSSTKSTTKNKFYFGTALQSAYDELNERFGINIATPLARLHLKHTSGSGTQTVTPSSANIAGSWGVTGGPPQPANTILSTNDGNTTIVQSGTGSDLDCIIPMSSFSASTSGTWTLTVVSAKNGALINGIGVVISNTTSFADALDGVYVVPTSMSTAPSYTTTNFTVSLAGKNAVNQTTWYVILRAGASNSNTINVTQVILTAPGALSSTPLQRFENLTVTNDINFASSSDSAIDLALTGTPPFMIASGSGAASGVRLYSSSTAGRIEFGSATSSNLLGVLSGQAGSVATSIRNATSGFLVSNAAVASLITPGALVDVFPTTDLKVLKLRPHSSQTNDILQVRNNGDSSTLASIDSTGKIVAAIGLQLSAQSPAAGKIATSSDANGNFTWSTASVIASTWSYIARTTTYSVLTTDGVIDCTSGTFTVTLPTAVGVTGKMYAIKNSGTGIITVATTSSQTIDGSTTAVLQVQNICIVVVSDGANWKVI